MGITEYHRYDASSVVARIVHELTGGRPLDAQEDLTSNGLDSFKTVQLIVLLEETFDIEFSDNELLFSNFSTLNKIEILVEKHAVSQRSELKGRIG